MKKTYLGFLVLLAVCSLSAMLVPSAHSQSANTNIKVLNYSYYLDSTGYLDVVGQIQNVGTATVESVILTGVASASDGSQSSSYTQAWVSDLTPQQEAPFYMSFPPPQSTNTWYSVTVSDISLTVAMANATSNYQYPDLAVTSSTGSVGGSGAGDFSGAYTVNGVIKNTGTQAATNLTVVGTFFNSTGAVVGAGYTNYLTPTVLEPGATASFQVAAFDLNQSIVPANLKITSYSLLVQALGPILQGTAPAPTAYTGSGSGSGSQNPTMTSNPSSTASGGQGSSGSQPSPTNYTWIYAAVAVVAIIAVAAALVFLRKRSKPSDA